MSAPARPPRSRSRRWVLLVVGLTALLAVGVVSAAFVVQSSSGRAGGVQSGLAFLTHWQQTGVVSSTTPTPVPAALSTVVTTPTRLAAASTSYRMNAATAGHEAVEWIFSESAGGTASQEIEIQFVVEYTVGAATDTTSGSVYVESQAGAIGGTFTFDVYWDAGAALGVTFVSESEISQACSSVGTCP